VLEFRMDDLGAAEWVVLPSVECCINVRHQRGSNRGLLVLNMQTRKVLPHVFSFTVTDLYYGIKIYTLPIAKRVLQHCK